MKSLNKNELGLLIGLLLIGSLISFYESGFFHTNQSTLIAQDQVTQLKLIKGDQEVIIPTGDWVVIFDKLDSTVYYSGKFAGISDNKILLRSKKDSSQVLPTNISTLYHGEKKRVGYYAGKGVKYGGIVAVGFGIFAAISAGADGYNPVGPFAIGTACVGLPSMLIGGIGGSITGSSKDAKAIEYPLTGTEAWILSIS